MALNRSVEEKRAREKVIEEYLLFQSYPIQRYHSFFPKKYNLNSEYCAVIVEPRSDHPLLEAVCRNVMYFLPDNWNLVVYSYDEKKVRERLSNIDFIFYPTTKGSYSLDEYSELFMSSTFWNNIPGQYIIIFQIDSYITRRFTKEWIEELKKYPFIGALYHVEDNRYPSKYNICSLSKERIYSMSGGFSFRNRKAMLDCIEKIKLDDILNYRINNELPIDFKNFKYEDFYFESSLYLLNYQLPSNELCMLFCNQVQYKIVNSYSVHGIFRDYVYEFLIYMLRPALFDIEDEIQNKIKEKMKENNNIK